MTDPLLLDTPIERLVKDGGGVTEADLAAFERLGVDREPAGLFGCGLPGAIDGSRFMPDTEGRCHLAVIVRAYPESDGVAADAEAGRIEATAGDVLDVLAFDRAAPGRYAPVLASRALLGHVAWRGTTVIHPHPLLWLAEGGRGVVVLDPAGAWPVLHEAESIVAADLPTAKRVRDLLERPLPTPPIFVRTGEGATT